jgi:hypothetical protein
MAPVDARALAFIGSARIRSGDFPRPSGPFVLVCRKAQLASDWRYGRRI